MKKTLAILLLMAIIAIMPTAMAEETNGGEITLADGASISNAIGATVNGDVITIEAPGEYSFTGSLTDGQIVVNSDHDGEVILVMNNVSVHNEDGAAIYVEQNKNKTIIKLLPDTSNAFSGGEDYVVDTEDEPNAVIFARDDLEITGGGKLMINSMYRDGIACKDDLVLSGITVDITSVYNGVRGKDSLEISDCTMNIVAGNDALKSTNDSDPKRGYVSIVNSTLNLICVDDPISAVTKIYTDGCSINVALVEEDEG